MCAIPIMLYLLGSPHSLSSAYGERFGSPMYRASQGGDPTRRSLDGILAGNKNKSLSPSRSNAFLKLILAI